MDRNLDTMQVVIIIVVALRKESVDRNTLPENPMVSVNKSLSARRAWIEITSVVSERVPLASLSARRAWIEIVKSTPEDAKR